MSSESGGQRHANNGGGDGDGYLNNLYIRRYLEKNKNKNKNEIRKTELIHPKIQRS